MAAVEEVRRLIPAGLTVMPSDADPNVLLVLNRRTVITVINATLDVVEQVREDTCERHRVFCCSHCFRES